MYTNSGFERFKDSDKAKRKEPKKRNLNPKKGKVGKHNQDKRNYEDLS